MIKSDLNSQANPWELEVLCKNRDYLNKVIEAILSFGHFNFEVETIEITSNHPEFQGIYTGLVAGSWLSNSHDLAEKLSIIENGKHSNYPIRSNSL